MSSQSNSPTTVYLGQTIRGVVDLRTRIQGSKAQYPYVIADGAVIQLNFPGAAVDPTMQGASVILSTANEGEITINDPNASQLTFEMAPAKSALLFMTRSAAVDCLVTNTDGSVDTFEAVRIYNITSIANP